MMSGSDRSDRRILFGLMLPAMLMPMLSTMSRVALPTVRDTFSLTADLTAWIDVALRCPLCFSCPFTAAWETGWEHAAYS